MDKLLQRIKHNKLAIVSITLRINLNVPFLLIDFLLTAGDIKEPAILLKNVGRLDLEVSTSNRSI